VASSGASRAASRPRLGTWPCALAGASTGAGACSPALVTRGTCHRASRAGSRSATATPAPRVKTLSIASVTSAVTPARFVTTCPLTRCLFYRRLGSRLATRARDATAARAPAMESHPWAGWRGEYYIVAPWEARVEFDVIIEIPRGQRNKYEMDHVTGRIRLDRMLFTSTRYPSDYGF